MGEASWFRKMLTPGSADANEGEEGVIAGRRVVLSRGEVLHEADTPCNEFYIVLKVSLYTGVGVGVGVGVSAWLWFGRRLPLNGKPERAWAQAIRGMTLR
jgi:hypothetical protein